MRRIAALLLLLLSCESDTPQAETIRTVGGSNPDYATIQACADNAPLPTSGNATVCLIRPGTYNEAVDVDRGGVSSTGRFVFRAVNAAVSCPDIEVDPFDCVTNTSNRSIIDNNGSGIGLDINADHVAIEGLFITDTNRGIEIQGSSLSNRREDVIVRFVGLVNSDPGGQQIYVSYTDDILIDHSYWVSTGLMNDYGIQCWWSDDLTVQYSYSGGNHNHNISIKEWCNNTLIEYFIGEGAVGEVIFVGQEPDSPSAGIGLTACTSSPISNTTTPTTIHDTTAVNVTIRNVFIRPATGFPVRFGIRVAGGNNVRVENGFAAGAERPFSYNWSEGTDDAGRCGIENDNIVFVGLIAVNPTGTAPRCFDANGSGFSGTDVAFYNSQCYGASGDALVFGGLPAGAQDGATWWDSTQHARVTLRNTSFHTAPSGATNGAEDSARFINSHNGWFNVSGGAPGNSGGGDRTDDPQLAGPLAVANGSVDSPIWDWPTVIQPIIDQFRTENANYADAGVDVGGVFKGDVPDIGSNEWLQPLVAAVWASCATTQDGEPVFDAAYATPWIDGRTGLVIDVDCEQKKIVIGRCDDPLDEETCDTDIYIYKQAYLRNQRVNDEITLDAGTAAQDEDTEGVCWRTRAVFDFSESRERVFGVWIRYEIDPDGGTHDCTEAAEPPQWAWQGFD
jgi:hypothetical protein